MKKRNKTTSDVITSTRYLASMSGDRKRIIEGVIETHQLTNEFIIEFRDLITTENFSKSYMLKKSLVDEYPDYFQRDLFINSISEKSDIDIDMLIEYFDDIRQKLDSGFDPDGDDDEHQDSPFEMLVIRAINNATQEEMESANVVGLVSSLGENVDRVLLRKVKDDSVKDMIMLAIELNGGSSTTATAMKYIPNSTKENILGTENVDPKELLKFISDSNDLGWVIKMIKAAVSGEIKLEKTTAVFDKEVLRFVANAPESVVVDFIKLREYMPNALSYKVLSWVLVNKDFDEDTLIDLKDVFKKAGMFFELKRFAKNKDFDKLLSVL